MTKREALRLALEALELTARDYREQRHAITAIREALAQPEFPMHEEGEDGWSDFVCPDPKSYLMKCCDCGLVHEAQFKVVRYKSEAEREDCEPVDDPNLQAVFRMRRSEQWSPKDTAYRPGGLAQPEQEPVAWRWKERINNDFDSWVISASEPPPYAIEQQPLYTAPPQRKPEQEPVAHTLNCVCGAVWDIKSDGSEEMAHTPDTTPPQRKPLTDEEIWTLHDGYLNPVDFARAIEAAHGIKE